MRGLSFFSLSCEWKCLCKVCISYLPSSLRGMNVWGKRTPVSRGVDGWETVVDDSLVNVQYPLIERGRFRHELFRRVP